MELEEFKTLVAVELKKQLNSSTVMGIISICGIFAILFMYIFNQRLLGNASAIVLTIFIGFFIVRFQKKINYLDNKYKLPKNNLLNILKKNE